MGRNMTTSNFRVHIVMISEATKQHLDLVINAIQKFRMSVGALKKRPMAQISGGLSTSKTAGKVLKKDDKVVIKARPSVTFNDISWDCLRVIIGFLPLNDAPSTTPTENLYKNIRLVSRDFYALICQRRKALLFKNKQITEKTLLALFEKCSPRMTMAPRLINRTPLVLSDYSLQQLAILAPLALKSGTMKLLPAIPGL